MTIKDAPDGTLWVQTVNLVVDIPTPSEPAHEALVLDLHKVLIATTSYQTVAGWIVSTGKVGILGFVVMQSDNYAETRFRFVIEGSPIFEELQIETGLSLEFLEFRLAAGCQVYLEARSWVAGSSNVVGGIIGKEIG